MDFRECGLSAARCIAERGGEPCGAPVELSPEMNDHAAFDLDRWREKGFGELLRFIEESLARLSDPDPGGERPHSLEEFRHLVQMLRELDDTPAVAPVPMLYEPTRKLREKRAKLERLNKRLSTSYGEPHPRKRDVQQMLDRQPELKREIAELETSERANHAARLAAYQRYSSRTRTRAVNRINKAVERAFKPHPTGRRLQWRPARPGSLSVGNIRRYYEERRRHEPGLRYDMDRIEKAYELGPDEPPWEGPDGFEGYIIFTFPGTNKALMECPEIGNAAYVIHKDWETWSQMDKQELMAEAERGGEVTRIPHLGDDWPVKVRQALELE
jgi:hypothetical protein